MDYDIKSLEAQLNRNNQNNFIFELYNRNVFHEDKFYTFIASIVEFVDHYSALQNLSQEQYFSYMNEIIKNCEDILWSFTRHYMREDEYTIKNFAQIENRLTQYYMYLREYSERLILNIQE